MIPIENISSIIEQLYLRQLPAAVNTAAIIRSYNQYCLEFNAQVRTCVDMAQENNIAGLMSYVESEDMEERFFALLLKDTEAAEKACEELSLPRLERVDSASFLPILNLISDFETNLSPLIEAYRKIARAGSVSEKIALLRKIVDVSGEQEWLDVLKENEQILLDDLAHRAKNAILSEDYAALKRIRSQFGGNWKVKPKEIILRKIDNVLREHHLREAEAKVKELLRSINDAYSAFDVKALGEYLSEYDMFMSGELDYTPEKNIQQQIAEAREYFNEQAKELGKQADYERLVEELRVGLLNEQPLAYLQKRVNTIMSMGYNIPENLLTSFAAYQENAEAEARRRRMVKSIITGVICIAVIGGISFAAYTYIIRNLERQWLARLAESNKNNSADETLKLFADLEKSSAAVSRRPAILEIRHKVERRKAQEDIKRETFRKLSEKMRTLLGDYAKNRELIDNLKVQLIRNVVDQKERAVLEEFELEIGAENSDFLSQQKKLYFRSLSDYKQQYAFLAAAVLQCDIDKANTIAAEMKKIRFAMEKIPCSDVHLKKESNRVFRETANIEDMLNAFSKALTAPSFDEFTMNTRAFVQLLAEPSIAAIAKPLENSDLAVGNTLFSGTSSEILALPFFSADAARLTELNQKGETACKAILADLDEKLKLLKEDHMVILRNEKGEYCNLLFAPKVKRGGKMVGNPLFKAADSQCVYYYLTCYRNQSSVQVSLTHYEHQKRMLVTLTSRDRRKKKSEQITRQSFIGDIVYPENFSFKAPHVYVPYLEELKKQMQSTKGGMISGQQAILVSMLKCFEDGSLNPMLKLGLLSQFSIYLAKYTNEKLFTENVHWYSEIAKVNEKVGKTWLITSGNKNIKNETAAVDSLKKFFPIPFSGNEVRALETVLNRNVKPVGYIYSRNSSVGIKLFDGAPQTGEVWLTDAAGRFVFAGNYKGNEFIGNDPQIQLFKVVFSPSDKLSTPELAKQFAEKMPKDSIPRAMPVEYTANNQ